MTWRNIMEPQKRERTSWPTLTDMCWTQWSPGGQEKQEGQHPRSYRWWRNFHVLLYNLESPSKIPVSGWKISFLASKFELYWLYQVHQSQERGGVFTTALHLVLSCFVIWSKQDQDRGYLKSLVKNSVFANLSCIRRIRYHRTRAGQSKAGLSYSKVLLWRAQTRFSLFSKIFPTIALDDNHPSIIV